MLKNKQFITLLPQKKEYQQSYFRIKDASVCIKYDENINLTDILASEFIRLYMTKRCVADYHLTLIFDTYLISNDSCSCDDFISKKDAVYNPNFENHFYQGESAISILYYPAKCIVITRPRDTIIISGNQRILKYHARQHIKRFVNSIFRSLGYYPMHASCVVNNNMAYLFPGNSHSGKSTLFLNLSAVGFKPMNDDIVFLKLVTNSVLVESIPLLVQVRASSDNYLNKAYKTDSSYNSAIDVFTDNTLSTKAIAKLIVFPEISSDIYSLSVAEKPLIKKKLLSVFNHHCKIEIAHEFAALFHSLLSLPIYSVRLGNNLSSFIDFLRRVDHV